MRAEVAAGAQSITLEQLPYKAYMHHATPYDAMWADRFKLFYGIPKEVAVVVEK